MLYIDVKDIHKIFHIDIQLLHIDVKEIYRRETCCTISMSHDSLIQRVMTHWRDIPTWHMLRHINESWLIDSMSHDSLKRYIDVTHVAPYQWVTTHWFNESWLIEEIYRRGTCCAPYATCYKRHRCKRCYDSSMSHDSLIWCNMFHVDTSLRCKRCETI